MNAVNTYEVLECPYSQGFLIGHLSGADTHAKEQSHV